MSDETTPTPEPVGEKSRWIDRQVEALTEKKRQAAQALDDGDPTAVAREMGKRIGSATRPYVRHELKHVAEVLAEGEPIRALAGGEYGGGHGLVVATDRRVFFYKKGRITSTRVEDFPYSRIGSVSSKKGMVWGTLTIHASGHDAKIEHVDPSEMAVEIADIVREMLHAPVAAAAPSPLPPPPAASADDRLRRLAALHADGLVSDAEYQAKRAELLGEL